MAQGAVLKGAGIGAAKPLPITILTRAYGFICSQSDVEPIQGKTVMVGGRVSWLLRQGDLVPGMVRTLNGDFIDEEVEFNSIVDVECNQRELSKVRACVRFVISRRSDLPQTEQRLDSTQGKFCGKDGYDWCSF